jgi:hypothetical protein
MPTPKRPPANPKAPGFNPRPTHKQREAQAAKIAGKGRK